MQGDAANLIPALYPMLKDAAVDGDRILYDVWKGPGPQGPGSDLANGARIGGGDMRVLRPRLWMEGMFSSFESELSEQFPKRRTFEKGDFIYGLTNEGNPYTYYTLSGSSRYMSLSENGSMQTWSIHGPGTIFPLYHNYDGADTEDIAALVAAEKTETIVMPKREFHAFLMARPAMIDAMMDAWMYWSTNALYQLETQHAPLRERVCGFLLLGRDEHDEVSATHEVISQAVGASRENVTRVMRALQEEGAIEQKRGRVRIVSAKALVNNFAYADSFFNSVADMK